jgi:hypothetical protein
MVFLQVILFQKPLRYLCKGALSTKKYIHLENGYGGERRFLARRRDYGETPTNQADTAKLLVDFSDTTSGVKARVRGQTRGYSPNANAPTDPILCGEG